MERFNAEQPPVKDLSAALREAFPDMGSVNSLMESLQTEEEMQKFFDTYVEFAKNDGAADPESVVTENIRYIVGQFSDGAVTKRWTKFVSQPKNFTNAEDVVSHE